jgi:hypothetical protein
MSGLLGGGGSSSNTTAPAYTGLQIQTAVSTLPVPLAFGTNRLAPNLTWRGNFQTIANTTTTSSGGKGGSSSSSSTTYTYTVAAIMALCEGPISGVGTVWKGQSTYTLAGLGLTLFSGATPQPAWGWLQGYQPDEALSYAGTAYVAASAYDLGSSASLDNHNFELYALQTGTGANGIDADPALVIQQFLTNLQFGVGFPAASIDISTLLGATGDSSYQTYCKALGLCISPFLTDQETAQSILQRWLQLTNTAPVWSGTVLKFIPYGDEAATGNGVTFAPDVTPIYDLDDTDFVFEEGTDPVEILRSDPSDAYNVERLEIMDRANAYAVTPVEARDQNAVELYGLRIDSTYTAHEICDPNVAAIAGQLILQRNLYVRNTYKWKLSWEYCLLEPMDIVTLTRPAQHLDKVAVRITNVSEDEGGILAFTAEELPAGVATAALYPKQGKNPYAVNRNVAADPVNPPVIFEPSAALTGSGAQVWIGASGGAAGVCDPNWGGADVWVSPDGTTYEKFGTISGPARQGALTAALPAFLGTGADTANSLCVNLAESGGVLANATEADAQACRTLCWVDGEIIAYATATLTGPYRYTLTYLERGLYDTAIAAHAAGTLFLRLDQAIFKYGLPEAYVGQDIRIKLPSFNVYGGGAQSLDEAVAYTLTPTGAGYTIAPPTGLVVTQYVTVGSTGMRIDLQVSWTKSPSAYVSDYEVSYSVVGTDSWISVRTAGAAQTIIADAVSYTYDIKVCAIGLGLTSAAIETTYTLITDDIKLAAVTGLELCGQGNDHTFTGRDAKFDWRLNSAYGASEALSSSSATGSGQMDAWFLNFQVTIYDTNDNELRTELVTAPSYTYTYQRNVEDGGPHRTFRIEVVWHDTIGRTSEPATITVTNPPPGLPTAVAVYSSFKHIFVDYTPPTDLDYAGTEIWMSGNTGFAPTAGNKVYDGVDTKVVIAAETGETYYLRLASYDSFGEAELTISGEYTVTTAALEVQDISDGIVTYAKLYKDLQTDIDRLDPTNLTDPNSVASQILAVTGLLNQKWAAAETDIAAVQASAAANAAALVQTETAARADADSTLAAQITNLAATVGGNVAAIQSETSARASADAALGSQLSALSATVGSNQASLASEINAAAGTASAAASSIQTLQSTVNGNTSSIQTLQSTVNGVTSEYTVKIDSNGYVAGFGLIDGETGQPGVRSAFIVRADQFAVGAPGDASLAPFVVQNGVVYINAAQVLNLQVQTAQIAMAAIDTARIADLNITTAKIAANAVSGTAAATGFDPTTGLVTHGDAVFIIFTAEGSAAATYDSVGTIYVSVDGTIVAQSAVPMASGSGICMGTLSAVTTPSAGYHTFSGSNGTGSIFVLELQK